ncbi:uncharacterized protein LY89DRAFT_686205 [Mollisia scopiformis]|uniref:Uncharacterized protein n=1 Tax=Mollisia scopiformis TaxID=149040 RepID=A0A194X6M6_MOLSC|nr:uncharacterized protein LY89DRAFT_686205 [Mollisia scopiformis]KUJ15457.1 hypothetical protein LY89DRAFT_686205 [Mollisia scopiformis]
MSLTSAPSLAVTARNDTRLPREIHVPVVSSVLLLSSRKLTLRSSSGCQRFPPSLVHPTLLWAATCLQLALWSTGMCLWSAQ